jgi:hypothetical protein
MRILYFPFTDIVPGGSPDAPPADPKPAPVGGSPAANKNVISEADALKGASHTQTPVFSVSDPAKPGSGPTPGAPGSGINPPGQTVQLGGLVQAKVVVEVFDALIPAVLVLAFLKLEIDVKKTDFQLTAAEKNTLAPILEACLNSVNLDFSNPWTALAITMIAIYGGKALEKGGAAFIERKMQEKKPADPDKHKKETPPPPLRVVRPEPQRTPDSTNNDNFNIPPDPVLQWSEADVVKVEKKRKKGRADAIAWLNANFQKKGGVI